MAPERAQTFIKKKEKKQKEGEKQAGASQANIGKKNGRGAHANEEARTGVEPAPLG